MGMRHFLGLSEYKFRKESTEVPVFYEPEKLITSHLMLCGMSGTGKSFQSKRFLSTAAMAGVGIDVFDVHEELDGVHGAVAAKYSQATGYGYNPLVLDTDPHSGGVNRQADFIVGLIRQVTTQFGSKQEAALRNLIVDLYMTKGIFADNPRSWVRQEITERRRSELIESRSWQALRDYYPTLGDLMDYAERKVLTMMFGSDNKVMGSLESLCRLNSRLQSLKMKAARGGVTDDEVKKLEEQINAQNDKVIEAFEAAVRSSPTREPKDLIKYDSKEVLVSVVQRLQVLSSAGIFNANAPDFGGSKVRVHGIKSLSDDQQKLFVKLRLREIFEQCKKLGPTENGTELRHVAFLDEAPKYFSDETDDIINVVSRESRKFGLGLWCAAQEPTSFPQSFITNCGAKFLLGIDASFWKGAIQKMRITEEGLKFIKAKEVLAAKLQREGQSDPPFSNVIVPNPNSDAGRRSAAFASR
jgi:hypothetical protein